MSAVTVKTESHDTQQNGYHTRPPHHAELQTLSHGCARIACTVDELHISTGMYDAKFKY